MLALDDTLGNTTSESTYNNPPKCTATIMSPPVTNSTYGNERNIQYARHSETAENNDANEVANDNDSDEGTATLSLSDLGKHRSRTALEQREKLLVPSAYSHIHCDSLNPTTCGSITRQTLTSRHIGFTTTQICCSCVRTYTPVFLTKSSGPSCHAGIARLFHTCGVPKIPSCSTTDGRHTHFTPTQTKCLHALGQYRYLGGGVVLGV
jgi:hypothetical protein